MTAEAEALKPKEATFADNQLDYTQSARDHLVYVNRLAEM